MKPYKVTLLIMTIFFTGCYTINNVPCGAVYAKIKGPVLVTNSDKQIGPNSIGISKAVTIFYVFTFGDAGINKALGGAKIPTGVKIHHIDFSYTHFLGCGKYKTIVYYDDPSKP